MRIGKYALVVLSLVVLSVFCFAGTISPQLQAKLENSKPAEMHKVILALVDQADIYALDGQLMAAKATLAERNYRVIAALQEVATLTQPPILAEIDKLQANGQVQKVKSFWLANLIALEATEAAISQLSQLKDVGKITIDYPIELIEPVRNSKPVEPQNVITSIEQGLVAIHAPEAWALGYTGAGRVVSNLDTGVDGTHPALASRFRGDVDSDGDYDESWYDPYDTHWTFPQDSGSHGTHTMGTICGRTPDGDTIGVAIDAQWIATAPIDRGGDLSRTASDALLSFQWIADPDDNPLTQDNPDACGNSWGIPDGYGYPDCDETFWVAIDNCEAAGTVVIFSAGNEGASGLRSPADRATTYYNCFSVGAIDAADNSYPIAYFSALGPSECATGDLAIKPEVVAPGVSVRSSIPGGGYALYSGTSMASPHVTGSVAVIRQANPNLDANTIKELLMATAEDLPFDNLDGEENTFGHGIINLYQAVLYAQGYGSVDGYITDATTLLPIPGKVKVAGLQIETYANQSGYYIFGLPADTTFTLESSYFGYLPQQRSVAVVADDTVRQNFALTPAPSAVLEGTVTSIDGDSIANAEVTILDTPVPTATTNSNGFYNFLSVPSGSTYRVQVKAIGYSQGLDSIYVQNGVTNFLNFSLWPAESFEFNNGGYSGSGVWEWGTPTYGPSEAWSGTKLWGTVLNGTYGDNVDDNLISTQFTISMPDARLEFYHWYETENSYDGGNVAISTNGGVNWTVIDPVDGYPDADISAFDNLEPGYTNSSAGWKLAVFNLSSYYNQNVMLRWRFGSDPSVVAAGWYIDDVVLIGATPPVPPDMSYNPSAYNVSTSPGSIEVRNFTITNDGEGPLYFSLATETYNLLNQTNHSLPLAAGLGRQPTEPLGYQSPSLSKDHKAEPYYPPVITDQGGPDAYGYSWKDSNEPGGPSFSWVDITSVGTVITGLGDDTNVGPFPIGFTFDYYGDDFTSFRFCTNGFISFTSSSNAYSNAAIPTDGSEPFNLLAAFWDDLDFNYGGTAYYYSDNSDSLIISWVDIPHWNSGGPYSFQIIVLATGKIVYQYQSMVDPLNSATIGIQNSDGSIGLQTAYNAAYVENNLAIEFAAAPEWLTASPLSGVVAPHNNYVATVRLDATELPLGIYNGNINMLSNDPVQPDIDIPVIFNVGSGGTPDMSYSPSSISATLSPYAQVNRTIMLYNHGTGTLSVTFSTALSWIQFSGGPRYVAPNDSTAFVVTLNSAGLLPGLYNGTINFASNDPDMLSGSIPASLTVLAPDLSFSPSSLTDSLAEGEQASHQIAFSNDGDGTLTLNFTAGDSWIEIDSAPGIINPHAGGILQLTLNAAVLSPGTHTSAIGFTSNDPAMPSGNIPITLYIYGPNIAVNPVAIGDTLDMDEQSTKNLYIENTGEGTLTYTVNYQTFNPLAANANLKITDPGLVKNGISAFTTFSEKYSEKKSAMVTPSNPPVITNQGGPDEFGYWWIDSNEPNGPIYNWIDISSIGTPITVLGDDDNSGPYAFGFNFAFYDNIYDSFRFCTNGFISFTSSSGAWQEIPVPTNGEEPLDLIAPLWDDLYFPSGGSAFYYTNNSDSLIVSWISVPHYGSGGPYTFQAILLANGKIVFQYQLINEPANSNTVGIQNSSGTIGLQIAYDAIYAENGLAVELRAGSWLTVSPTAGMVEPFGRDTLHVDFDATGLADGSYQGQISIASNDPETPTINIPANLEIGLVPLPQISLNVSAIVDTVFSSYSTNFELLVSNIGLLNLTYSITDDRAWITENPAGGTINPGMTDSVTLTFSAATLPPGNYSGTVTITSNDPAHQQIGLPVQLAVVVAVIPDIEILPPAIERTVVEGGIDITPLRIGNTGSGTLTYSLTDNRNWIAENPASGAVSQGEVPDTISVTLDASALTQGTYAGTIAISSNDPDEGLVNANVILHVVQESACDYKPGDINGDDNVIGSDVTYAINYFRGGTPPPDSCQLSNETWLYTAADANGDCRFIGSDVTYMVNFFRGGNPPQWCSEVPPVNPPTAAKQDDIIQPTIINTPTLEKSNNLQNK